MDNQYRRKQRSCKWPVAMSRTETKAHSNTDRPAQGNSSDLQPPGGSQRIHTNQQNMHRLYRVLKMYNHF